MSAGMIQNNVESELKQLASKAFPEILRDWKWPVSAIIEDSKRAIPTDVPLHWKPVVELFQVGDVIWTGDTRNSGRPQDTEYFCAREEWLSRPQLNGPLICPATFQQGCFQRRNEHVVNKRFLIIESDNLPHDDAGAIIHWFHIELGWKLRCIVDSGNKSLHAWFDFPGEKLIPALRTVLPELHCDTSMLKASQLCRLPGVVRKDTGKYQKLIYLA
jgi:hypothetical protein